MKDRLHIAALVAFALLSGCISTPGLSEDEDIYPGYGTGATLGQAMNAAKTDAVRNAVIDLIGAENEARYAGRINEVLYTSNPNAYVFNDTLTPVQKAGSLINEEMHYELTIKVNVPAVRRTLELNDIPPSGSRVGTEQRADPEAAGDMPADPPEPVSEDEARFIRRFVDTMTYMVYFAEDAAPEAEDPEFLLKSAVNQANGYLVADGRLVVDADQVERLKKEQELVYEEETGTEISLLQWVARRLNADVYIELDARVDGTTRSGSHYGTADVTLNMFDTSTGQILGSVNRRSQESFSRSSRQDAVTNALLSTVYQAMPNAVDMARTQMSQNLRRGIRYELTIQNPPDPRSMSRFRLAMRDGVREIQSISQSENETVYEVFAIGSTDDIVDLVYLVSDRVAGFEDMILVISRGRSVTFDAGY